MQSYERSELEQVIETFDLVAGVEPSERYESVDQTPRPEQIVLYFHKLEEIARARQSAQQRSGQLYLR